MKTRTPQQIHLHIEDLVLHGFMPQDRLLIGEAVQRELTRLYSEQDMQAPPGRAVEIARLDGGTVYVEQGASPDTIGTQVAQAIYGGLKNLCVLF